VCVCVSVMCDMVCMILHLPTVVHYGSWQTESQYVCTDSAFSGREALIAAQLTVSAGSAAGFDL